MCASAQKAYLATGNINGGLRTLRKLTGCVMAYLLAIANAGETAKLEIDGLCDA